MKLINALIALATLGLTGCATNARVGNHLNTINYKVGQTLQGNPTTTGVVLQADNVNVKTMNGNLLVALPTAITDAFVGTDLSSVKLQAKAYVIRLDGTRYQREQLITVVQGPEAQVRSGDHVYIVATPSYQGYDVRLIPVNQPQNYKKEGMREAFERQDKGASALRYAQ